MDQTAATSTLTVSEFLSALKIHTLGGYSAHADQAELIDFVRSASPPVGEIRLIHGEDDARRTLAALLRPEGSAPSKASRSELQHPAVRVHHQRQQSPASAATHRHREWHKHKP